MRTKSLSLLRMLGLCGLLSFVPLCADTAAIRPESLRLVASGGELKLTASAEFDAQPSAVGWSLELPAGWTFVKVEGAQPPQVMPAAGAVRVLDFAYTNPPGTTAVFTVIVRYPAGVHRAEIPVTVIIRAGGKSQLLTIPAVQLAGD